MKRASEIGLNPPFPGPAIPQLPLVIMCYLFRCVNILSDVRPPAPQKPITGVDFTNVIFAIEQTKRQIEVVTSRVNTLALTVEEISLKLKSMRRPSSSMARHAGRDGESQRPRPHTSFAHTQPARRVTWDLPDKVVGSEEEESESFVIENTQNP
jgi:hypothetical protein